MAILASTRLRFSDLSGKPKTRSANGRDCAQKKYNRIAPEVPVEDTIIDVIEEPAPGVVVVTEYETIRTATPISSDREPKPLSGPETEEH